MKASRAAQGLGKHSRPRVLKRWSSSAFSESSASRSGARHFWCQSERDLQPQSNRHRSMPCTQLQELFSWISTSHSAG